MESTDVTRTLKIFCPTHQSVFEVESKPQIICEIREHSLSNGFPKSEFWEYCCDCKIFSPSDFGTGGKAKTACPHCERATTQRFLCDECKIIAYDSDTETKGKIYSLNAADGIAPNCVGCQKSFSSFKIYQHKCTDIESLLLTSRKDCPFCLKPVLLQPTPPKMVEPIPSVGPATQHSKDQMASTQCPACGHWGQAGRAVCGKCGVWIDSHNANVAIGTTVPKTQLLGSICPNCGIVNDVDSTFCVNCAQALKAVPETETIVNPRINTNTLPPNYQLHTLSVEQPTESFQLQQTTSKSNLVYFVTIGGIIFFGFVIWIAVNSNKNPATNSNSANYSTYGTNSNNSTNSNSPAINNPSSSTTGNNTNFNTSSSSVGRTGRLTRNVNIRSASNKFAQIIGTHYQNARVEILNSDSYYADDGEFVTWYRVKVLENGYDSVNGNGTGNNWERDGQFGWMEASMEGWMNSKFIDLE